MKLQCSCGAKYAFEATPDMLQHPVKFICPSCGLDASDFVNDLIRQEFGGAAATPPPASSQLKVAHEAPAAAGGAETAAAPSKFCAKHRERASEKCAVCQKPLCPKCLQLFGYFCSPLCKGKAEAQNLDVPVYAGQRDVVESVFWRKTGLIGGLIAALILLFVGAWIWYAWFGSVPHRYFSVRFADDDRAYSGSSRLVGTDQLVFLHGSTLARYDLKSGQPVWSQEVITKRQVDDAVKAANEEADRIDAAAATGYHHRPPADDIARAAKQELQDSLRLFVSGQNIWVDKRGMLTHYDWNSGQAIKTVDVFEAGDAAENGDDLEFAGNDSLTHLNLASGELHTDKFGPPAAGKLAERKPGNGAGLPSAGGAGGQLDPQKIAAQAQNLKLQGRLALPAILSNARHEQDLENALNDDAQHPAAMHDSAAKTSGEVSRLVIGDSSVVWYTERLLEEKLVKREAMKAPPKKSTLDGNLNASQTTAVANEILNDMQRNAGGDTVTEDQSRYQVTLHLPDAASASDWAGEVVGPPQLFVLKTVNVIAAGRSLTVLDKSNKKLWQASLTYPVSAENAFGLRGKSPYGDGPCVEQGNTLYVFDQAVLTAFDRDSGNARWRLPSVGVVGLFFDAAGNVYVNTTTGNPDDVRYARQIDVTRKIEPVVYKLDSATGKTLWSVKPEGYISYLSGKFIYVMESYDPNPTDADVQNDMIVALQKSPYLRIARLRDSDGKMMWEYYDRDRCPVAAHFDNNSIELVFKREVEVLRYLTF
jgi:outer membrane protein assembly factor BamB